MYKRSWLPHALKIIGPLLTPHLPIRFLLATQESTSDVADHTSALRTAGGNFPAAAGGDLHGGPSPRGSARRAEPQAASARSPPKQGHRYQFGNASIQYMSHRTDLLNARYCQQFQLNCYVCKNVWSRRKYVFLIMATQ